MEQAKDKISIEALGFNERDLHDEINDYKQQLESGKVPELPTDISLRVELARIPYDPDRYLDMGDYSDIDIVRALLDGHIIIYPFNHDQLNPASYNFVLGEHAYAINTQTGGFYNMFDEDDIASHYEYVQATTHQEWSAANKGATWRNIPPDTPIFVLRPHQQYLNHSHEYIGIRPPGNSSMYARSTTGRNTIFVCKDAGLGDPGYINRWTVETENGRGQTVAIPVGYPIGQFVFTGTGKVGKSYELRGSYQKGSSLTGELAAWQPELMLPKARYDQISPLIPIAEGEVVKLRSEHGENSR